MQALYKRREKSVICHCKQSDDHVWNSPCTLIIYSLFIDTFYWLPSSSCCRPTSLNRIKYVSIKPASLRSNSQNLHWQNIVQISLKYILSPNIIIFFLLKEWIITAYWPRLFGLYCEISDRGFLVWTERRRSEVHAKNRGLIFHSTDRTSEVNNRFIIWLDWVCEHMPVSRELNRLLSVSLGNNIW
jgi:hypothetical protein